MLSMNSGNPHFNHFTNKFEKLQDDFVSLDSRETKHFGNLNARITQLETAKIPKMFHHDKIAWAQWDVPTGISVVLISMVGGGGAGGVGFINNGKYYSGGGGGSGEVISRYPVVLNGVGALVKAKCGMGGNFSQPNGSASTVEVWPEKDYHKRVVLTASGGLSGGNGINNKGGLGGVSSTSPTFDGSSGISGQSMTPEEGVVIGGNGANSWYGKGGKGGNSYFVLDSEDNKIMQKNGGPGTNGAGGGGSIPDPSLSDSTGGDGGNGFILIEYA